MYCQISPAICRDTLVLFPCIHDMFFEKTFQDFCNFNYFSKIHALSSEGLSASVRYALWDLSNLECTRHWHMMLKTHYEGNTKVVPVHTIKAQGEKEL